MPLKDRAEATAEYLAEEQWSNSGPPHGVLDVGEKVDADLAGRPKREHKSNCRDEAINREELDTAIKKSQRDKAPGPDDITTDWLKDLDDDNRNTLLILLNE